MAPKITPPKERFMRLVKKTRSCWLWTSARQGRGYGFFKPDGTVKGRKEVKGIMAHRYSYLIHVGKIPKGSYICHKCDNKLCVNPAHLFLGNATSNAKDMVSKERHRWGENRPHEHYCPRSKRRAGKYCNHNIDSKELRLNTQRRLRKNGKFK